MKVLSHEAYILWSGECYNYQYTFLHDRWSYSTLFTLVCSQKAVLHIDGILYVLYKENGMFSCYDSDTIPQGIKSVSLRIHSLIIAAGGHPVDDVKWPAHVHPFPAPAQHRNALTLHVHIMYYTMYVRCEMCVTSRRSAHAFPVPCQRRQRYMKIEAGPGSLGKTSGWNR